MGYAAFKVANSRYHASPVAQPHEAMHIVTLMKGGEANKDGVMVG